MNRDKDDPLYFTTNSNVPHLPFLTGFMGTHGTYRFQTVNEQTLLAIGEGKINSLGKNVKMTGDFREAGNGHFSYDT